MTDYWLLPSSVPAEWTSPGAGYLGVVLWEATEEQRTRFQALFPEARTLTQEGAASAPTWIVRSLKDGVANPVASSLATVLEISEDHVRIDQIIQTLSEPSPEILQRLSWSWKEPAIEELFVMRPTEWRTKNQTPPRLPDRRDDSFDAVSAAAVGLEFTMEEGRALEAEAQRRGRAWTRAELEIFAQTWSEHCKHKIFGAEITTVDTDKHFTDGLFKTHIRKPSLALIERNPSVCLSVFVDNAGVLALFNEKGESTDWAYCLKMETHNSPSAISPYGGASTGIVGVHRDILGTGLGARPIANWDVLCFETPGSTGSGQPVPRPKDALPADVIRKGVIKGIEDGGNQSGIPTVQGSVVFDPSFAVKPLVYAGSIGLLKKSDVEKRPKPGLKLYCFGGATGADGLRGAVMSSRDLRGTDFSGSAVQVANAFVQRRLTDFLMAAQARSLVDVITDNGAGGLASSVGEMAQSTGGATIDLTSLRLKYAGLHAWERLLSESQERMTVATSQPEALEALAQEWQIPFDRLGVLDDSGSLRVRFGQKDLIDIRLEFLHDGCPRLQLASRWTHEQEDRAVADQGSRRPVRAPDVLKDFATMLESPHLCSREGIVRRFDHEVQGRTFRKPFSGRTGQTPQDGALMEVPEATTHGTDAGLVLAHGLAPQRDLIEENTVHAFDEALRSSVLAGARLETAGLLDNFCWSDPIPSPKNPHGERRLWRLVRSCEALSTLVEAFEIPLISGKDSMKNNSADFAARETLVVSVGASAGPRIQLPGGHFSRANDVVFCLPPLRPSLRDSAWERVFGVQAPAAQRRTLFEARAPSAQQKDLYVLARELRTRYRGVAAAVHEGLFRSAKDISEGGLLQTVFEMGLGRELGIFVDFDASDTLRWFGEGLGGFVFSVDPHLAQRLETMPLGLQRLGVVVNIPKIRFPGAELDLFELRDRYLKKTREGFWS